METFIVRIHPRGDAPEEALHGLVESVGVREARAFQSDRELLVLLRDLLEAARRIHPTTSQNGAAEP
jgi:hypothetical protein